MTDDDDASYWQTVYLAARTLTLGALIGWSLCWAVGDTVGDVLARIAGTLWSLLP